MKKKRKDNPRKHKAEITFVDEKDRKTTGFEAWSYRSPKSRDYYVNFYQNGKTVAAGRFRVTDSSHLP